jgi:hypothetical protein
VRVSRDSFSSQIFCIFIRWLKLWNWKGKFQTYVSPVLLALFPKLLTLCSLWKLRKAVCQNCPPPPSQKHRSSKWGCSLSFHSSNNLITSLVFSSTLVRDLITDYRHYYLYPARYILSLSYILSKTFCRNLYDVEHVNYIGNIIAASFIICGMAWCEGSTVIEALTWLFEAGAIFSFLKSYWYSKSDKK